MKRIVIIAILLLYYSLLQGFTGRIVFDNDMCGLSEIEYRFCVINHHEQTQHMLHLLDYPENNEEELLVRLVPVPANSESTNIHIHQSYPNFQGSDIEKGARWFIYDLLCVIRNFQIYTIPVMNIPQLAYYSSNMAFMAEEMFTEHEKVAELERTFEIVTAEDEIQMTGFRSDLISRLLRGNSGAITIHKSLLKNGIFAHLISVNNISAFIDSLRAYNPDISEEYIHMLIKYNSHNFVFLVYGFSNDGKYKDYLPLRRVIQLLEKGYIDEAKMVINSLNDERTINPHNRDIMNSLLRDLENGYVDERRLEDLKSLLFERGSVPCVSVSFPSKRIFFPMKQYSIYGNKRVPLIIYVTEHLSIESSRKTKNSSLVNYFGPSRGIAFSEELREFFSGYNTEKRERNIIGSNETETYYVVSEMKYTKIKLFPISREIQNDLTIFNAQPPSIGFANFITKIIWDSTRGNFWHVVFISYLIVCLPLSLFSSMLSGLIVFKRNTVKKWKMVIWGIFNVFSLTGFIMATYFLRTKQVTCEMKDSLKGKYHRKISGSRLKYYVAIAVFAVLSIFWFFLKHEFYSYHFNVFTDICGVFTLLLSVITIMILSTDEIGTSCTDSSIEVIDIRKLAFLLTFNLLISGIGIYKIYFDWFSWRLEKNVSVSIALLVFVISIVILFPIDILLQRKPHRFGLYLVRKDNRKLAFIIIFSFIYIALTYALQFIGKLIL